VSGGVTIRSFSSSSVDRVQSRIFCCEAPIVRRWCFAAHARRRGDRIEMLFAAVHWSLMALSVIRRDAPFCPLLDKSGHAEPVLANLKN
jgi:hypothetical protein